MKSYSHVPQSAVAQVAVHSLWQVEGSTPFRTEHIIPKGIIEIVFNFSHGNPVGAKIGKGEGHLPTVFINGFNTAPISLQLPPHQAFFGIRLYPLAVKDILAAPASEFLDLAVDLTLLDKQFETLWHQLTEQPTFNARVRIFLQWIGAKCSQPPPRDKLLNTFLCSAQHDVTVAQLSGALCYSSRQLSRRILAATGLNAEGLLLYKKYLHAVHLMERPELSLTEIGYASAFSDQSHFVRTFRLFAQRTPGAYRRAKGPRPGHLFEDVR